MSIQEIFPTKVYSAFIENVDEVQEEISNIIESVDFLQSGKLRGYANKMTSVQKDAIKDYKLDKTYATINQHLQIYCEALDFPFRPYKLYSWFTKNEPGDYLQIHHHNDVDITGTYYFQSNGDDGEFFFESPVIAAPHSLCFSSQHTRIYAKPEAGKLVLFPGWINHGVLKNTSESSRIGLSFNVSFAR